MITNWKRLTPKLRQHLGTHGIRTDADLKETRDAQRVLEEGVPGSHCCYLCAEIERIVNEPPTFRVTRTITQVYILTGPNKEDVLDRVATLESVEGRPAGLDDEITSDWTARRIR
jgi:hypothetical protein